MGLFMRQPVRSNIQSVWRNISKFISRWIAQAATFTVQITYLFTYHIPTTAKPGATVAEGIATKSEAVLTRKMTGAKLGAKVGAKATGKTTQVDRRSIGIS